MLHQVRQHRQQSPQLARLRWLVTLALRAFDAGGWLKGATLTPGTDALDAARDLLARDDVAYLHAHYAGAGCYAAWVGRAEAAQAA